MENNNLQRNICFERFATQKLVAEGKNTVFIVRSSIEIFFFYHTFHKNMNTYDI